MNLETLQSLASGPDLARLAGCLERAVRESYGYAPLRGGPTAAETAARARFAVELAVRLRREVGWSVERVGDEVPKALRARLLGLKWEPAKGRMWVP